MFKKVVKWIKDLFVLGLSTERLDLDKHKREDPLKDAVYTLGSADPIYQKAYTSFSGVDIKVTVDGERFYAIQSLEFTKFFAGEKPDCTGKIVEVLFDEEPGHLFGKTVRLVAVGANEYGKMWKYFDKTVKFTSFKTKVSIDDIIIDAYYDFEVVEEEE